MATRKPVVIDGEFAEVRADARLIDIAPPAAVSVSTSAGQVIPRAQFERQPVPDGFEWNLSPQVRGCKRQTGAG